MYTRKSNRCKKENFSTSQRMVSFSSILFSEPGIWRVLLSFFFIHCSSSYVWRVRHSPHSPAHSSFPFLCNCTRFIIVSWTCSIIKIVSTLETELLALKLLQVEVGSLILLLPTHEWAPLTLPKRAHTHTICAVCNLVFLFGRVFECRCRCITRYPIHSSAISGLTTTTETMTTTAMIRYVSASYNLKALLTSAKILVPSKEGKGKNTTSTMHTHNICSSNRRESKSLSTLSVSWRVSLHTSDSVPCAVLLTVTFTVQILIHC